MRSYVGLGSVLALMCAMGVTGCADGDEADRNGAASDPITTDATSDTAPRVGPGDTRSSGDSTIAGPGRAAKDSTVTVFFSRAESTVGVQRAVRGGMPRLEAALRALVRGPTAGERANGIHSWFSDTTASALRSVDVDGSGRAVVEFADLTALIPNASTSAGSAMLLRELNGTVFAVRGVTSVEYRIEGSCEAFWEWLQRGGCPVQTRSDVAGIAHGAMFTGIPATRFDGTDEIEG